MSSFDVTGMCKRGETAPAGTLTSIFGKVGIYQNFSALTDRTPRDQRNVWMMFVKNGSGGALLPGQLVAWKTLLPGNTVTNPATSAGVQIAGVVDHLLPAAGVADGLGFLITVLGPTKFLLDANATSAEFDNLLNSASVAGAVRTGTSMAAGTIGRNEAAGTTAAGGGTLANATSFFGFFNGNGTGP